MPANILRLRPMIILSICRHHKGCETSGTSHWWKNLGDATVILYVGDVLHDKADHNM